MPFCSSKILIFEEQNGIYKAAMANPLDIQTIRDFERKLGGRIQVHIAYEDELIAKIKSSYSNKFGSNVSDMVEAAVSSSEFVDISEGAGEDINQIDVNNAPVAKIVNMILESAVQEKASDVHIEPMPDKLRVRFRIHGILREMINLPSQVGPSLVSRIKILSDMQIDEKRKPLDGRFQIKAGKQEIDLRVSTLPTVLGEKVVIRLLRKDLGILSLEDTGMRGNALKTFQEGLKSTSGIILVTGPTGSGKTVTVATSMHILNKPEVNVVSIEDPVEIKIKGVNQVQVNVDAGLSFAAALRSFLRQDPNIISVGEIRDGETAQLAAQASLTGHLVVSTLHTNSAAGVLPRLMDMGIEPFIIASTVHICSAQRLCRRICKDCKVAYEAEEAEIKEIRRVLSEAIEFNIEKFSVYQQNLIQQGNVRIIPREDETPAAQPGQAPSQPVQQVAQPPVPQGAQPAQQLQQTAQNQQAANMAPQPQPLPAQTTAGSPAGQPVQQGVNTSNTPQQQYANATQEQMQQNIVQGQPGNTTGGAIAPVTAQPASTAAQSGPKIYLFKGTGCDKCAGTGYAGRVGIFEVFKVNEKIGRLVMQHATADEIENEAMNSGMMKMIQDGFSKSLDGLTTVEEVLRVIHS
jgi:type II secretory ATPase GspE/PulE/Tfp pilus assembly ATPase PilB-like protein